MDDSSDTAAWRTLLEAARHAPSPHNVQPWRVRILDASHAELLIERRRTLPKEDPTGSFIVLTMGLFIETLRLVAAHRGRALQDELLQDPSSFTTSNLESLPDAIVPFARLQLTPAAVA